MMRMTSLRFIYVLATCISALGLVLITFCTGGWNRDYSKTPVYFDRIEQGVELHEIVKELANNTASPAEPIKDQDPVIKHFLSDWPPPMQKPGCRDGYKIADTVISVVIYLCNSFESLPLQTFLSVQQFTLETEITLTDVIVAYKSDETYNSEHLKVIAEIKSLDRGRVQVKSVSASSAFKAKLAAVEIAKGSQVLVIDDTHILNHGYIKPLIRALELNPEMLVYPHSDSLLTMAIYLYAGDATQHADKQIWQEMHLGLYKVEPNMEMSRTDSSDVTLKTTPEYIISAGLTGKVFFGMKIHIESILSRMNTDEPAELSVLSWLCGQGIIAAKCSTVVLAQNDLMAPTTMDKEPLLRIYNTTNSSLYIPACKSASWYFQDFMQQYRS